MMASNKNTSTAREPTSRKSNRQSYNTRQKRNQARRDHVAKQHEMNRFQSLYDKWGFDEKFEEPSDLRYGDALDIFYKEKLVVQFRSEEPDDIPDDTAIISDLVACTHDEYDNPDVIPQLDGVYDGPFRTRSASLGSDVSVTDIHETDCPCCTSDVDDEPMDIPEQVPPSLDPPGLVSIAQNPSGSDMSMDQRQEIQQIAQHEMPIIHDVSMSDECLGFESPIYRSDDEDNRGSPIYMPHSPGYVPSIVVKEEPFSSPDVGVSLAPVHDDDAPSTSRAACVQRQADDSKVRIVEREVKFIVACNGWKRHLPHQYGFISKNVVIHNDPLKVVLTRECCLNASMENNPQLLHIAEATRK